MHIYRCTFDSKIDSEKLLYDFSEDSKNDEKIYFIWKRNDFKNYNTYTIAKKINNKVIRLGKAYISNIEDYDILDNVFNIINNNNESNWYLKIIDSDITITNERKYPNTVGCKVYSLNIYFKNELKISYIDKKILNKYLKNKLEEDLKKKKNEWKKENIIDSEESFNNNLDIQLFDHQIKAINWMLMIEKNILENKPLKIRKIIDLEKIKYNLLNKKVVSNINNEKINIYIKGGILADESGMGKTLSMITLISNQKKKNKNREKYKIENNMISTNQTIILCPSYLCSQWKLEIKNHSNLKSIIITGKSQHKKLTLKSLMKYDIIIVSYKFVANRSYYTLLNKDNSIAIKQSYQQLVKKLDNRFKTLHIWNNKDINLILNSECPVLFELFNWNRLIIDEGHKIYEENTFNRIENIYLRKWLNLIESKKKWYISSVIPNNIKIFSEILKFLDFRLEICQKLPNMKSSEILKDYITYEKIIKNNIDETKFIELLTKKIYFRSCKSKISKVNFVEKIHKVKLIKEELDTYNSIKIKSSKMNKKILNNTLQKICSNYELYKSNKFTKLTKNNIITEFNRTNNIELIKLRDSLQHQCNLLFNIDDKIKIIESFDDLVSDDEDLGDLDCEILNRQKKVISNNIIKLQEKIKLLETTDKKKWKNIDLNIVQPCVICMEGTEFNRIITFCGHYYCKKCLMEWLKRKKNCPACRNDLDNFKIFEYNIKYKLGSKIKKIIEICKKLLLDKKKIIIFSQWSDVIESIGEIINNSGIKNIFIKGCVDSKKKITKKFDNNEINVILLTTKNKILNIDLTKISDIIFLEPINKNHIETKKIESYIINKTYKLYQQKNITIHRLIAEDTIEENIYMKTKQKN